MYSIISALNTTLNFSYYLCARGSKFADALCELCVKCCEDCANECKKHDMECCKKCAEACTKCAEACKM